MDTAIFTKWVSFLWILEVVEWGAWPQFTIAADTDCTQAYTIDYGKRRAQNTDFQFPFPPLPNGVTRFTVFIKGEKCAFIILSNTNRGLTDDAEADPGIPKIGIGTKMSSFSGFLCRSDHDWQEVNTPSILNTNLETELFIEFTVASKMLEVGKVGEPAFMSVSYAACPQEINYFGIASGYGANVEWRYEHDCHGTSTFNPRSPNNVAPTVFSSVQSNDSRGAENANASTVSASIQPNAFQTELQEFENTIDIIKDVSMDDILSKWESMNSFLPEITGEATEINSKYFDIEIFRDEHVYENDWDIELTHHDMKISFPENAWRQITGDVLVVSVLNLDFTSTNVNSEAGYNFQMGSRIISINMFDTDNRKVAYTSKKIFTITFTLLPDVNGDPSCQFIKTDGQWSPEGCVLSETNKSHVICSCNHMTSFAVLVQFTEDPLSVPYSNVVTVFNYLGQALSISALCFALLTMALFSIRNKSVFQSERMAIHRQLIVAMLLAMVTLTISETVPQNIDFCKTVTVLLHYLFLSTFSWMLVEGIHLYRMIVLVYGMERNMKITYVGIGWGVPLVTTVVSLAIGYDYYGYNNQCWLPVKRGFVWAFLGPASVIILINIVVLVVVLVKTMKAAATDHENIALVKVGLRGVLMLLPMLGVGWIIGFAGNYNIYVTYIFDVLSSVQVFKASRLDFNGNYQGAYLVLVIFGINSEVRRSFVEQWRRLFLNKVTDDSWATTTEMSCVRNNVDGTTVNFGGNNGLSSVTGVTNRREVHVTDVTNDDNEQ